MSALVSVFADEGIQGIGVTLPVDRQDVQAPENVTVVRDDVNHHLREVARLPESDRPKVIYSEKMFRWVANPLLTLKLAYNALPTGGYLLVDEIYNGQMPLLGEDNTPVDPKLLEARLRQEGYDITFGTTKPDQNGVVQAYSVSLRKTENQQRLRMPVSYITVEDLGLNLDDFESRWDTPFESVHHGTTVLYKLQNQSSAEAA